MEFTCATKNRANSIQQAVCFERGLRKNEFWYLYVEASCVGLACGDISYSQVWWGHVGRTHLFQVVILSE